jgi:hypothetical protein
LIRQRAEEAAILDQARAGLSSAKQLLSRRETEIAGLSAEMANMTTRLSEIARAMLAVEQARDALLRSASWRITKPVRALAGILHIPSRRGE